MMSNGENGTTSTSFLQPYIDALQSTSLPTTAVLQRAVINKLLQDSDIFYGYNVIKYYIMKSSSSSSSTTTTTTPSNATIDPKILNTLDLFSYGTLSDYTNNGSAPSDDYLSLSEAQLYKLRQLTALSVITKECSQSRVNVIPYQLIYQATTMMDRDSLMDSTKVDEPNDPSQQLQSKSLIVHETEHILAPLIASKMIVGKLSQQRMAFLLGVGTSSTTTSINSTSSSSSGADTNGTSNSLLVVQSRDVNPETILPQLLQSIQQLRQQVNEVCTSSQLKNDFSSSPQGQYSQSINEEKVESSTDPSMLMMPMEVERIHLTHNTATSSSIPTTTTTTITSSANKRSRSDGGTI